MGSGENSPAMVTPHQMILKDHGKDAHRINLDTPYGFQENADELTARILGYFETNVGFAAHDIHARDAHVDSTAIKSEIEKADWLFSGLRIWKELGIDQSLKSLLSRGSIVMASAAAMSLGSHVVPVYEMYKVGTDPHWLPGLDVLGHATGIKAAVVAHFNNTQGGTHDTRFCFIGEKRMNQMIETLDSDTSILGIDEHTGISFNLETFQAQVFGKGSVTFIKGGESRVIPTKKVIDYRELVG
jgi:cyanophycinase-like exopeptidase